MLQFSVIRAIRDGRFSFSLARTFHHEFTQKEPQKIKGPENDNTEAPLEKPLPKMENTIAGTMKHKYQIFQDEDATEIFDVEEERQRLQTEVEPKEVVPDELYGLNLNRGVQGVFDIEDLVDVLRKESAEDIFVCSVPKELKYVDYMVVCSGRSFRHMFAIAEFVRRIYKHKRNRSDIIPKIEGEKSRKWMALDLGNIALHVFSPEAREEYDLESLWSMGVEYDKETNKPQDPFVELFEKHSIQLNDTSPQTKVADC